MNEPIIEHVSAMHAEPDGTVVRTEATIIGPRSIARPEAIDHTRAPDPPSIVGYPFEPNYDACADPDCGEVWSPRGPTCPACGGPALGPR